MYTFTRFHPSMSRNDELNALNDNFNQLELKSAKDDTAAAQVQPGEFQDYTATLAGWSATTTNVTRYTRIGNMITVYINIIGTSNNATTTISLPVAAKYDTRSTAGTFDTSVNTLGILYVTAGSSTLNSRRGFNTTVGADLYSAWAASGSKQINGAFFTYEADE